MIRKKPGHKATSDLLKARIDAHLYQGGGYQVARLRTRYRCRAGLLRNPCSYHFHYLFEKIMKRKKYTIPEAMHKPSKKSLDATRRFMGMANDGDCGKAAEAPVPAAKGPSYPTTPTPWTSYGVAISTLPAERWVGELMKVPPMYKPQVAEGLCRQALSDIYDATRFATWWRSPWRVINERAPMAMAVSSPEFLIQIVLEKVKDYNNISATAREAANSLKGKVA